MRVDEPPRQNPERTEDGSESQHRRKHNGQQQETGITTRVFWKKKEKKKKGIYEILLIVHTTVKLPRIEPDRADAGLSGPRKPVDKRQELVEAT